MSAGLCDPLSQVDCRMTSGPLLDNGLPPISLFVSAGWDGDTTWNWLCRESAIRIQPTLGDLLFGTAKHGRSCFLPPLVMPLPFS